MNQVPHQIPSFMFRRWAMAAIRPMMSVLIVVALIAALPGLIASTVMQITGADPSIYTQPVLDKMMEQSVRSDPELPAADVPAGESEEAQQLTLMDELDAAMAKFRQEKGAIYFSMLAINLVFTSALAVILNRSLLNAVCKREVTLAGALAMLKHSPKALLIDLWMLLRMYAWMLPGLAVMIAAMVLFAIAPSAGAPAILLMLGGMIAAMVLGIRAGMHYGLAGIAFADDPTRSPNACITVSWQIMRRRKMEFFFLQLSFIGWNLLISLMMMMCVAMFGSVVGMALYMMANLFLSLYISAAQVCFYMAYSGRLSEVTKSPTAENSQQDDQSLN